MADTDILLTVDLDTTNADKTAEQLQKEIENIFNTRQGNQSAALTSLELQMKKMYDKATELREKMAELADTQVVTPEYQKLEADMTAVENEAIKLAHKMKAFERAGGDTDSSKYQQWARDMELLAGKADVLAGKLNEMRENGTDVILGRETEEYQKLQAELDAVNDKLKQQIVRHHEISDKELPKATANMTQLHQATEKVRKSTKDVSSNLSKGLSGATKGITKLLGKFAILFLGFRGLYSLLMKIRSYIVEGFKNLRESGVGNLKKQMNDLTNACTTLKNALAGAFQPIVSTIIPYIQKLVEWLTVAIDKLAQFIAAMHGQTTYIKAIKQVGDAAGKANKQLAKFDELNVLTKQGNGAAGMFEEAKIADEMLDRVAELKKKIAEIKEWLDKYIFNPIKSFIAWFLSPITDNIDKIKLALYNLYLLTSDILGWIREKIMHAVGVVKEVYDEYIKPTMDKIMGYVSYAFGKLLDFWNKHYAEIKWIIDQLQAIWDESVQPIIDEAMRLFGAFFALIGDFITSGDLDTLFAGLEALWTMLYPHIQRFLTNLRIGAKLVSDFVLGIMQNARKGVDFIRKMLEENGDNFTTFKNLLLLAFEAIGDAVRPVIDLFLQLTGAIASFLDVICGSNFKSALGNIEKLTSLDFGLESSADVSALAALIDAIAGTNLGNISSASNAGKKRRRGMASGGVIPPNASKHFVMVGDNNHETEVVSPLSTMQEAMINALQSVGFGAGEQPINIYLGTDKIYSEIRKMEKRSAIMGG